MTTSAIPYGHGLFDLEFDFIDHRLHLRTSDGDTRSLNLEPKPVATFYTEVMAALRALNLDISISAPPVEVERAIPFAEDTEHASYDPDHAHRFWRQLVAAHRVLSRFRSRFIPTHPVRPEDATYNADLNEFLLPYEAVRTADDPDQALLHFLQTTYEAAAEHGSWNRDALEASLEHPATTR